MNIRGLLFTSLVVLIGSTAIAASPPAAVKFTLQFPTDITMNRMPSTGPSPMTTVQAGLALANTGQQDMTLTSPNACTSHTWTVTEAGSDAVIDSRSICTMIFLPVDLKIAAGKSAEGSQNVMLANGLYTDGRVYTLHYRYWGYEQTANFTVHSVH
ncbi:MAG TPA: hypothetical protein VGG48_15225 [Rhizomicrobium sp.]|jgi:hypothetical protein